MINDELKCKCGEVLGYRNSLSDKPIISLDRNYFYIESTGEYQFVEKPRPFKNRREREASNGPRRLSIDTTKKSPVSMAWPGKAIGEMTSEEFQTTMKRLRHEAKGRPLTVITHREIITAEQMPAKIKCKSCQTLNLLSNKG